MYKMFIKEKVINIAKLSRIVKYNLEDRINKMYCIDNLGVQSISDKLKEEGYDVSHMTVFRYVNGKHLNKEDKICNRCGNLKPLSEFPDNRTKPKHKDNWCIECHREYSRKCHGGLYTEQVFDWYLKNKEYASVFLRIRNRPTFKKLLRGYNREEK